MNPYLIVFCVFALGSGALVAFKWYLDATRTPSGPSLEGLDGLRSRISNLTDEVAKADAKADAAKRLALEAKEDGERDRSRMNGSLSGLAKTMKEIEAAVNGQAIVRQLQEMQDDDEPDAQQTLFPNGWENGRLIR